MTVGILRPPSTTVEEVGYPAEVPATGEVEGDVEVGLYLVSYEPPAGHVLAEGEVAAKEVTVFEDEVSEVLYGVNVVPGAGTLAVAVIGLSESAAAGGSVAVLRTDIPDQQASDFAIPGSGRLDVILEEGTYTVTYAPPGGYSFGDDIVNPQTDVVVILGEETTVLFSVSSQAGPPTPPDIVDWGFEGGTDLDASGVFKAGNLQPFIPNTAWVRDAAVFAVGSQSVRQDYPQSTANTGTAFLHVFSPALDHFFVRFAYRASATMPYDDFYKFIRHYRPGFGTPIFEINISNNGQLTIIRQSGVSAQVGSPAIQMRNLRETWNWFEYEVDGRNPSACAMRLWVNDQLYVEANNWNLTSPAIGYIQFNGTINSVSQAASAWFDAIGISTRRMGRP